MYRYLYLCVCVCMFRPATTVFVSWQTDFDCNRQYHLQNLANSVACGMWHAAAWGTLRRAYLAPVQVLKLLKSRCSSTVRRATNENRPNIDRLKLKPDYRVSGECECESEREHCLPVRAIFGLNKCLSQGLATRPSYANTLTPTHTPTHTHIHCHHLGTYCIYIVYCEPTTI